MDTYGDMVTLLLTFFVMLFAMSSVDETKWEMLVEALSKSPAANSPQVVFMPEDMKKEGDQATPGMSEQEMLRDKEIDIQNDLPIDLNELYEYIKKYIDANNMDGSVTIEKGPNSVYLRFDNNLFFDGDSADLRQASFDILDFMGDCFKSVEDQILFIRINGHTAAIPSMPDYDVNDWNLSSNRANAVASFFEEKKEIDVKKMMTSGYGKNQPIEANDTEEGRAKNRRVDIMVIGNDFDTNNAQDLYRILQQSMGGELFDDKVNSTDVIVPDTTPSGSTAEGQPAGDTASGQVADQAGTAGTQGTPADAQAGAAGTSGGTPAGT